MKIYQSDFILDIVFLWGMVVWRLVITGFYVINIMKMHEGNKKMRC